jgi:hypothetical protein
MPSLHCPACGQPLHAAPCADPRTTCLFCPRDHRYFVLPEERPLAQESATASAAKFPVLAGKPPAEVASFWLSDPHARSILNEQLAELLRTILDGRTAAAEHDPCYCPRCARPLSDHEPPDAWIWAFRCSRGHRWHYRSRALWAVPGRRPAGSDAPAEIKLHEEMTKATAVQLVKCWLNGNRLLASNLHKSVARVLNRWQDEVT